MQLKVLILSTGLGLGGGEKVVIDLASNLTKRGHLIKIVSMVPIGLMGRDALQKGLDVHSLNMKAGVPDISVIPQLIKIIREWQPDLLHSHMIHANLLARVMRLWVRSLPLVCTAHNTDESNGQKWRNLAYRLTDSFCDVTTNVTQAGVERYLELCLVSRNKLRFIPNSIDTKTYAPNLQSRQRTREQLGIDNQFLWLAIGRFAPQKDYPTLIRAFALLVQHQPDALLAIAGEGILQPEIESLVDQLHLNQHVLFLGPRRDVAALMNAADAQVLSSAWEGMPIVLLEAASSSLPIVATDVGGVAEIVVPGESGYLVPPHDPTSLFRAMGQLMNLPASTRRGMGDTARQSVITNYGEEQIVTQWENLYVELLQKKRHPRVGRLRGL